MRCVISICRHACVVLDSRCQDWSLPRGAAARHQVGIAKFEADARAARARPPSERDHEPNRVDGDSRHEERENREEDRDFEDEDRSMPPPEAAADAAMEAESSASAAPPAQGQASEAPEAEVVPGAEEAANEAMESEKAVKEAEEGMDVSEKAKEAEEAEEAKDPETVQEPDAEAKEAEEAEEAEDPEAVQEPDAEAKEAEEAEEAEDPEAVQEPDAEAKEAEEAEEAEDPEAVQEPDAEAKEAEEAEEAEAAQVEEEEPEAEEAEEAVFDEVETKEDADRCLGPGIGIAFKVDHIMGWVVSIHFFFGRECLVLVDVCATANVLNNKLFTRPSHRVFYRFSWGSSSWCDGFKWLKLHQSCLKREIKWTCICLFVFVWFVQWSSFAKICFHLTTSSGESAWTKNTENLLLPGKMARIWARMRPDSLHHRKNAVRESWVLGLMDIGYKEMA